MASKPRNFNPGFYYHIYNRATRENKNIFRGKRDYQRFINLIDYYRFKQVLPYSGHPRQGGGNLRGSLEKIVEILAYMVMPNHFHLLVKPLPDNPQAVSRFVADIVNGYTRYFNVKSRRVGPLFQGKFKSKEISDEPSLLQLSRYIHLNPIFSTKTNSGGELRNPQDYLFSSYLEWAGFKNPHIVSKQEVQRWVSTVGGPVGYRDFVESKITKNSALGIEDIVIEEQEITKRRNPSSEPRRLG